MHQELFDFRITQKHESVQRKSDIEKLFSKRCRVVTEKAGPTQKELIQSMVGKAGELPSSVRTMGTKVLMAKGVIKYPTVHEKYQKVFDKYTLDHEEFQRKKEERHQQLKSNTFSRMDSIYEDDEDSPIILHR